MSGFAHADRRRAYCSTLAVWLAALTAGAPAAAHTGRPPVPDRHAIVVTTARDGGPGSLRSALLAAAESGPSRITFDPEVFAEPAVIRLEAELPAVAGDVVLDGYIPDRLWRASGVTLDGSGRGAVLRVAPTGIVELRHLTVTGGRAESGGGIENRGALLLHGVTVEGNRADTDGGGVAQLDGELAIVNSTLSGNRAGGRGGALAVLGGTARIVHATFAGNGAARGGAIFNRAHAELANSIVADSTEGLDCVSAPPGSLRTHHSLIEALDGCGEPLLRDDPALEPLGYYNGPTRTHPIGGGSPALNRGDRASAVAADGSPLRWDQRRDGDPRSVGGYPDLGAFEYQRLPEPTVDTPHDDGRRGCTRSGRADCPLRAALELANEEPRLEVVRFDETVFPDRAVLRVGRRLPWIRRDLILDAGAGRRITVVGGPLPPLLVTADASLTLSGVGSRTVPPPPW